MGLAGGEFRGEQFGDLGRVQRSTLTQVVTAHKQVERIWIVD